MSGDNNKKVQSNTSPLTQGGKCGSTKDAKVGWKTSAKNQEAEKVEEDREEEIQTIS
ncbi:MAG: hypothetical protein OEM02_03750 [Desulfobulbaceae bacterium]|nr:hypothetical protein [Desulfobulbaceae bacterium]